MTPTSRLTRLERALRRARASTPAACPTCAAWPPLVLDFPSPDDDPPTSWRWRPVPLPPAGGEARSGGSSPAVPPTCPTCGRRPQRLRVEFVDDWRAALHETSDA
jgi:hypothetical protein